MTVIITNLNIRLCESLFLTNEAIERLIQMHIKEYPLWKGYYHRGDLEFNQTILVKNQFNQPSDDMAPRMHSVYSCKLFKLLCQEDEEVYQSVHHDQGFCRGVRRNAPSENLKFCKPLDCLECFFGNFCLDFLIKNTNDRTPVPRAFFFGVT